MDSSATGMESSTGAKQLVVGAQLVVEEIGEGFDPGNALESGVAQYPNVGFEFFQRFS